MATLRVVCILLGTFGVLDALLVSTVSNFNFGVILPLLMGLPLLVLGICMPRLAALLPAGWWALLRWACIAAYSLMTLAFAGTWILIDSALEKPAPANMDVVIVLGAGLRGETPTRVLRQRLDVGIGYLHANPDAVLILSGGKGEGETISEAEAMERYCLNRDIAKNRLLKETRSTSTKENFLFSYEIILKRFGENATIGFVTTDFHVYRAGKVAAKLGISATGIPSPDIWYIALNNHLRECLAVWSYWLRGDI